MIFNKGQQKQYLKELYNYEALECLIYLNKKHGLLK